MLWLTPAGTALLASALPAWKQAQRDTQRLLPRGAVDTISRSWDLSRSTTR